jgi:uncharacterized protein (DUF2237 family)
MSPGTEADRVSTDDSHDDDREERDSDGGDATDRNVLGGELAPCGRDPTTGYLRDGHCRDVDGDVGEHTLCAVVTAEFLRYSRDRGNDLITPRPEFDFPGLEPGDRWCLCVGRWVEAAEAGVAPPVVLEATDESVLRAVDADRLREHEFDPASFDPGTLD